MTERGEIQSKTAGRLRHRATGADKPVVGDWVVLRPPRHAHEMARIQQVLPRRSKFSRKAAGARTEEQVVAANIDYLFVVMGLDGDFNCRRLERYLLTALQSGTRPVIVLTKCDATTALAGQLDEVLSFSGDTPVHVTSCREQIGLEPLAKYLQAGQTVALVGSSGAGKSTLLNTLMGEQVMRTGEVRRSDDRGQHTTSHRELVRLPSGALLIDNPGIRELQAWDVMEDNVDDAFEDVAQLAAQCRFRDCGHGKEPDCAVRGALADGSLSEARLLSYVRLQDEANVLAERKQEQVRLAASRRYKNTRAGRQRSGPKR